MKFSALMLAAGLAIAAPALAEEAASPVDKTPSPADRSRCINVAYIDHTQVVDDQTILFFLRGGQTLKNTFTSKCVGLRNSSRGFTYVARNDEICGTLQWIRVNDTGAVCQFGGWSLVEPPAKP